jgi:2,3-dihydroxybenzoate-AMP ligase
MAERYRTEGHWPGQSLPHLLEDLAGIHQDRIAVVDGQRRLSYHDLAERVRRMAAGFVARGIRRGDRVVVQLPNVAEFLTVCFALYRLGAIPVHALPANRYNEIRHLCSLSGATGYVMPGVFRGFDHPSLARRIRDEVPTLRHLFTLGSDGEGLSGLSEVDADPQPLPPVDPADVAFFLVSGGTTALPKLIPRTHDDYICMARAAVEACKLGEHDVYLATLPVPFNFTWGCPGVIGTLLVGGTVVLASDPGPDHCFALVEQEKVTMTAVGPTVVHLWLEALQWASADLSSLQTLQIGGSTLHPELAARVTAALGCRLQQVFGMAEGLITMTRAGDPDDVVLTTQGRPISHADEIRIVDERDEDVPAGTVGELLARGPYTLRGYYRADDHNARAFTVEGFYRSGDLAQRTAEGNLVIEGRLKDMINRGGDKVSAAEVEGHLLAHPRVAQVAVVPAPDSVLGERICAFVVSNAGEPPTLPQLKASLIDRGLAGYKLPDRLELLDALPLTGLGKVDKKVLAAIAAGEGKRQRS